MIKQKTALIKCPDCKQVFKWSGAVIAHPPKRCGECAHKRRLRLARERKHGIKSADVECRNRERDKMIDVEAKCPVCGKHHVIKQETKPLVMPRVYCDHHVYRRKVFNPWEDCRV